MTSPSSSSSINDLFTSAELNIGSADNFGMSAKNAISREHVQSINDQSRQATEAILKTLSAYVATDSNLPAAERAAVESPLTAPTGSPENPQGRAGLELLFDRVREILSDISLNKLAERLQLALSRKAVFNQVNAALMAEYELAISQSEAALSAAQADADVLENAVNNYAEKQLAFEKAKAALNQILPDDEAFFAAQQAMNEAEEQLNLAKAAVDSARDKVNLSLSAAYESIDKLYEIYAKGEQNAVKLNPLPLTTAMERLDAMISALNKILKDNNLKALEDEHSLNQLQLEKRQSIMKTKADDHAAELRKSEELNRVMGCVGRILGALITAISVIGALFTGGASLALAAVGMALMVADEIAKAVTGESFMEKALRPLMENVIQPLVEMLSKAITKLLEDLGVDTKVANMVGAIVGALAAAALVIAAIVVGKSAGSKVASSALSKMLVDATKKLIPDVLKNMTGQTNALITNSVKRLMEKLTLRTDQMAMLKHANRAERLNNGLMVAHEGVFKPVTTGVQGDIIKRSQYHLADLRFATAEHDKISERLKDIANSFGAILKLIQQQWEMLYDLRAKNSKNTLDYYRNTSA